MKKLIHLTVAALSVFCASCAFDEVIDEKKEEIMPDYPTEEPVIMLTDTMTVTVRHTTDTLPAFQLSGHDSMITGQSSSDGITVLNTLGASGVTLTGLIDIDSISIVVVSGE